jgi:hypothetical protein
MKNFIGVLLLICVVFVACDIGNNGNETISINELSIKNTGIRSLYISNIPVNGNTRAASGSTIQTLSYINSNGENTPFFFVTPTGKNIVLNCGNIQQLDNKRLTINFSSYYEITDNGNNAYTIGGRIDIGGGSNTQKTALIDMERGKVYDFSDWDIQLVHNDSVIASGRDYTIYKIDFNNISVATPLNNKEFFRITSVKSFVISNKLIGNNSEVIDINNEYPIKIRKGMYLTNEMCSFISNDDPYWVDVMYRTGWIIEDLSGNIGFFIFGGKTPNIETYCGYWDNDGKLKYFFTDSGQPDKYFYGKMNFDNEGQLYLTDYIEETLSFTPDYNNGRIFTMDSAGNGRFLGYSDAYRFYAIIIICDDGFMTLKRIANGIQVESTALSLPFKNGYIKDNYLYSLDNTTIKRIHLSSGSSVENLYSNNRILTTQGINISGDTIIFYQFADDNISVNTYSLTLNQQNPTPKLLSTSNVEIRNIIELDF